MARDFRMTPHALSPNVSTAHAGRMLRAWWPILLLASIVALWPGHVQAAVSKCRATSSGSLTLGNVTVPPGAAVGTLLGTPVQLTMGFTCTDVPDNSSGNNVYVQAEVMAARDASDPLANAIVFSTTIPGIGVRLTGSPDEVHARACLRCGPEQKPGFEIGPLERRCTGPWWNYECTATGSQTFRAQFVKTGLVTPGTVSGAQLLRFWWYEYGSTASSGPMDTSLTLNGGARISTVTCTVNTNSRNMTVTLPSVAAAQLPGIGATAGDTRFNIQLACPQAGVSTSIAFATSTPQNGAVGVIAPGTAAGTARGVGIQLTTDAEVPMAFNTAQPVGSSPNGAWSLPFRARYYRTDSTVGPGRVTGTASFTMTYD